MIKRQQRGFGQSARWITLISILSLASLLQTAFAIGVQASATAEQVCGDSFSHVLTVEWNVTDVTENIQVTITVMLPDGSTLTTMPNTAQGNVNFNLPLPGGGGVQAQVTAQQGSSSSSSSATASLAPCDGSVSNNDEESMTPLDASSSLMVDPEAEAPCESSEPTHIDQVFFSVMIRALCGNCPVSSSTIVIKPESVLISVTEIGSTNDLISTPSTLTFEQGTQISLNAPDAWDFDAGETTFGQWRVGPNSQDTTLLTHDNSVTYTVVQPISLFAVYFLPEPAQ